MAEHKLDIITIGESLIEFSTNQKLENAECLHKYYGGDSLVVAVAASRLKSKVGFVTCLGNDAFKDYLLKSWKTEELDISCISTSDDKNGIYLVSREPGEAKEFIYYRKKIAPAKLSIANIDEDYIKSASVIYASGVTQSLSLTAREAVKKAFMLAKENGVLTAYDSNFSSLVTSKESAKEQFEEILPYIDILFISDKHDLQILLGIESIENAVKIFSDRGIQTVVVKSSKNRGYYVNYMQNMTFIPYYTNTVVDTTSTGDAFNGAYLHAITKSYTPIESAKIAAIAAGLQAQGIGAIKSTPHFDEVYNIYKSEA